MMLDRRDGRIKHAGPLTSGFSASMFAIQVLFSSIRLFVVVDSIASNSNSNDAKRGGSRAKHEKDNKALLSLSGNGGLDPMQTAHYWCTNLTMWASEIGTVVAEEIGAADWVKYQTVADGELGHAGSLHKNSLHIASCLDQAWRDGKKSKSLEKLCHGLITFAKS